MWITRISIYRHNLFIHLNPSFESEFELNRLDYLGIDCSHRLECRRFLNGSWRLQDR